MGTAVGVVALLLLVVSCNALFEGGNVSPSNNPTVDEYHSSVNIGGSDYFEKNIVIRSIPGLVLSFVLFIIPALYFMYRWCNCLFCCRRCQKGRSRGRDVFSDEKREYHLSHPVISMVLRVTIVVLFLIIGAGIALGFLSSSKFHTTLVTTLQAIDDKGTQINSAITSSAQALNSLVAINSTVPQTDLQALIQSGGNISKNVDNLNSQGSKYDGIRHNGIIAIYVLVVIPLLVGLAGSFLGRGRYAFIMAGLLPLGVLFMWLLFSIHYAIFIVNVDVCYSTNLFLLGKTNETNTLSVVIDCTNATAATNILNFIAVATNETIQVMATNTSDVLKNQLVLLNSTRQIVTGISGCNPVADLMTAQYTNLCGVAVEASLYLWESQVAVGSFLVFSLFIGVMSEYRIARRKKDGESFNALLSLNED